MGPEAIVRFMNSRAERITGVAAVDVLGRDIREALPLQDMEGQSWWELADPWEGLVPARATAAAARAAHRA